MGRKFGIGVDVSYLNIMCEGQAHRSKFKVTEGRKVIFD